RQTFADDPVMWFLILFMLLSAALPHYDFINVYRISIGWAQIGVFEVGLALGLVLALVRGGNYASRYPSIRAHPVFICLMTFFTLASLFGIVGTLSGVLPLKYKVA